MGGLKHGHTGFCLDILKKKGKKEKENDGKKFIKN